MIRRSITEPRVCWGNRPPDPSQGDSLGDRCESREQESRLPRVARGGALLKRVRSVVSLCTIAFQAAFSADASSAPLTLLASASPAALRVQHPPSSAFPDLPTSSAASSPFPSSSVRDSAPSRLAQAARHFACDAPPGSSPAPPTTEHGGGDGSGSRGGSHTPRERHHCLESCAPTMPP